MFFRCPNCGADNPNEALICRYCGSDERTGWSENTMYDGLDLPGWDDAPRPLGFKDTLLYKDLKFIVGAVLFIAFLAVSLRW
jgi:hypothetical protein